MKKSLWLFCSLSLIIFSLASAQKRILYKQIDSTQLFMEIYQPEFMDDTEKYPAMVFFFGGGWNGGTTRQFKPHAQYLSRRGAICFLVEYRVKKRNNTTPFESVKDAKSAIRYIRGHANELAIDPSKIVAIGGSAGGHLAAATALITDYNEEAEDLSVSCIPDALVLFNPVIDNGPGGYGYKRIGDAYQSFSPLHNIRNGAPPTIFLLGTNDRWVPVKTARTFQEKMEQAGSRCDLQLYEDQIHGFFNYKNSEYYKRTLATADLFLQSLGFLDKEPAVEID